MPGTHPTHEQRDADKEADPENGGLLMDRSDFKAGAATGMKETRISARRCDGEKDCLADALTEATWLAGGSEEADADACAVADAEADDEAQAKKQRQRPLRPGDGR